MNKALQDGIIVDKTFLMIDEKKPGFRIPARIIQLLAVIVGSYSAFCVLFQSLSVPVNAYEINAAIFLGSTAMLMLCIFRSYDLVKLVLVPLFYGLFLFSRLSELRNGFYLFENLVITRLYLTYGYTGSYYIADMSTRTRDLTFLAIMTIIPVIALFMIAVVRNRLINLCCLTLLLPVTGSFLLGVIPSERYLVAYLVAILYLIKSGLPFRHSADGQQRTLLHRISSRAAVWISLICLAVFLMLKLFVSEEHYKDIAQLNDMKTKVTQTFSNSSIQDISRKITDYKLFEYEAVSGGLRGGELGKDGRINYTGAKQLVIEAPLSSAAQGIYLKGYVGSEYTGRSWDGHTAEDKKKYNELLKQLPLQAFDPVNQMNSLLKLLSETPLMYDPADTSGRKTSVSPFYQILEGRMQVEYKAANKKYIYAPYYTNYELLNSVRMEQDLYVRPSFLSDHYAFDYFYHFITGDSKAAVLMNPGIRDYSASEKLYRNYVYVVYTRLPDKGLNRLKKDFSTDKLRSFSAADKLDYVKNYLKEHTKYTLNPGKLPKGKDFVEYFLYENKKGFCAHYASAAALMLRAMGVPTRYVEGYAVGAQSVSDAAGMTPQSVNQEVSITVRDNNAHAWVEVYMDGCGWIPVEFTPGAAIEYNTTEIENLSKAQNYLKNSGAKPEATITPELTPSADKPDQYLNEETRLMQEAAAAAAYEKQKEKLDQLFIIVFLLMAASVGVMVFSYVLLRRRRYKKIKSLNKSALVTFAEAEKILAVGGILPNRKARLEDSEDYIKEFSSYLDPLQFRVYMEIVKKARFGRDSITAGELDQVKKFRETLFCSVYTALPLYKKLALRLALFVLIN